MITASLDPGAKGAIVIFDNLTVIDILDIPQAKWGSKQTLPDTKAVTSIFRYYNPRIIVIERVTSAPTDGVSSSSNFTQGLGRLEGCAADYRLEYVRPQVWKAYQGLVHKPKKASVAKALEKHPEALELIHGFKNSIDRSDAVLIGDFYLKIKEKMK